MHRNEAKHFYEAPVTYMEDLLTDAQLHGWSWTGHDHPSHVIIHTSLVDMTGLSQKQDRSIGDILVQSGYKRVWSRWNGIDWAENDDSKGSLTVWARDDVKTLSHHESNKHVDDL